MVNSADTNDKSQIVISHHAVIVNILLFQMSIRINSQPNWSEHTNSFFFLEDRLGTGSSKQCGPSWNDAAFPLGLNCLPNYIFKYEKWCEARSINS